MSLHVQPLALAIDKAANEEQHDSDLRDRILSLKGDKSLVAPSRPSWPVFSANASVSCRMKQIQNFISSFEYNYTGTNFFQVFGVSNTQAYGQVLLADMGYVTSKVKRITQDALPIKCVEAVYLGIHCTNNMLDVTRVPIVFNSRVGRAGGREYGHVVLLVQSRGKFGALGLSRRENLMFKDMQYDNLRDWLEDYRQSYRQWRHDIVRIKMGLPVEHPSTDGRSPPQPIFWKYFSMSTKTEKKWDQAMSIFSELADVWQEIADAWRRKGFPNKEVFIEKLPVYLPHLKNRSFAVINSKKSRKKRAVVEKQNSGQLRDPSSRNGLKAKVVKARKLPDNIVVNKQKSETSPKIQSSGGQSAVEEASDSTESDEDEKPLRCAAERSSVPPERKSTSEDSSTEHLYLHTSTEGAANNTAIDSSRRSIILSRSTSSSSEENQGLLSSTPHLPLVDGTKRGSILGMDVSHVGQEQSQPVATEERTPGVKEISTSESDESDASVNDAAYDGYFTVASADEADG